MRLKVIATLSLDPQFSRLYLDYLPTSIEFTGGEDLPEEKFLTHIDQRIRDITRSVLTDRMGEIPSSIRQVHQKTHTIIMGDIHGALPGLIQNLFMAGLIDSTGHWIAGSKKLIAMGDIINRGHYSWETYKYLKYLQTEAKKQGGNVILLIGNNELRLLLKNYKFTYFSHKDLFQKELIQDILEHRIQAAYEETGILYTHAGLHPQIRQVITQDMQSTNPTSAQISEWLNNRVIEDVTLFQKKPLLKEVIFSHPIYRQDRFYDTQFKIGGIFYGSGNDLLTEINTQQTDPKIQQIVGHTPTSILKTHPKEYWIPLKSNKINTANLGNHVKRNGILFTDIGLCERHGGRQAIMATNYQDWIEIKNPHFLYKSNHHTESLKCETWQTRQIE